jgi:hypothetical protein
MSEKVMGEKGQDPDEAASSATSQEAKLAALRAELDAIDVRLLDVMFDRLAVCARIGHHKKLHLVPMMAPRGRLCRQPRDQSRVPAAALRGDHRGDLSHRGRDHRCAGA